MNYYLKQINLNQNIIFSYLDPLIFINKKKLFDDKNYKDNDDVNWFNSLNMILNLNLVTWLQ